MAGPYHPVPWLRRYMRKADGPSVWPLLLKVYSGLMLVVHLVFGSIYFLPLLIRVLVLTGTLPLATTSELESQRDVVASPPLQRISGCTACTGRWMNILFVLSLAFGIQRIHDALHLRAILTGSELVVDGGYTAR